MIIVCRNYLVGKMRDAGVQVTPITSMKKLKLSQDPRVAAVIIEKETFARSGSKKRYSDTAGVQHKRRKVFSRETTFNVIIGDPSPEKVDTLFEEFLRQLGSGIMIDGNYTAIEVGETEWANEDDSILKSKVAVNTQIMFIGGVYRDSDLARITDVEILDVRKENQDGENTADQ